MKRIILIVSCFIGVAMGSLHAQGKWVPFVSNIQGYATLGLSMLNEQYGFAQTGGGTFRTTDGGKTWTLMKGFPGVFQIYYYTPSNLFVGGYTESKDSGKTWNKLPQPAGGQFGGPLYIKDGIFYDASGRRSIDHAKTWDTLNKVSTLTREVIVGNLDKGIAIWGGSGGGIVDSTVYSTDGGVTWHLGNSGVESDFGYALPYTLTYFRAGGDGDDAIQRTTDGGATWKTVFGPFASPFLSDGIAGDGCVVFAQTMGVAFVGSDPVSGVVRSTDLGQTWSSIGGPVSIDDQPLCGVTSRGAVCFAMSYVSSDPVMKFTDSSILRPILSDTKITPLFPDTVFMDECDSISIALQIAFSSCDYIRLHDLRIDSLTSKYYRVHFTQDKIIHEGHSDSSSITFLPNSPGVYNIFVHLNLAASDWSGSDTTLRLVLVVKRNPPILKIDRKDSIRFATNTLCQTGGSDTIQLSNPSCEVLRINNVRFETDSITDLDFSFRTILPYTLQSSTISDKIILSFHPQSAGIKSGKLIIESSIGNDTILVNAEVLPDGRILRMRCDSLVSPICDSVSGVLVLQNSSCRRMILDSLDVPSPYKLFPFQLPKIIDPGDSALLLVRFVPQQRGNVTISSVAKLTYYLPLSTVEFDTTVTLNGFGLHGPSTYTLSAFSVTFDTLHLCDSTKRRIVLYSIGCDSLPLQNISINGDPDFQISGVGTKSKIATGDSIVFNVLLNPISLGNKSAVITIILQDGSKVTIPITSTIVRSIRILSEVPGGVIDFGKHLTCQNGDTLFTLANHSCDTIRVLSAGFQGSGFGTSTKFPITLLRGESEQIDIFTMLDTSGGVSSNSSQLTFSSDASNVLAPITLIRGYIYPHPVHVWLDADKIPLTSSSIWKVNLKGRVSELTDVQTIDLSINYNTDLLTYLPNLSSAKSIDGKLFHLTNSPAITPGPDSSIAQIVFEVYLAKDTVTSLVFNNITLNSSNANFMGCIAVPQAAGIDFNYFNNCGDPSIRRFMRDGNAIRITFIRPNPAQDELQIDLQSAVKQDATIEILNALGAKVYSDIKNVASCTSSIHLDTRGLSSGVYLVRVGGASQSFVKVK